MVSWLPAQVGGRGRLGEARAASGWRALNEDLDPRDQSGRISVEHEDLVGDVLFAGNLHRFRKLDEDNRSFGCDALERQLVVDQGRHEGGQKLHIPVPRRVGVGEGADSHHLGMEASTDRGPIVTNEMIQIGADGGLGIERHGQPPVSTYLPLRRVRRTPQRAMMAGMSERLEVQRAIAADPATIFEVLTTPQGHVTIDSSGMLMDASGDRVRAVGDSFVVHMDREALNDYPMGLYDVVVKIVKLEPDREVAWTIEGQLNLGHVYGYRLEPIEGGTLVTSYYDWSTVEQSWKDAAIFPVIPEGALRATLGILARTVAPGRARPNA